MLQFTFVDILYTLFIQSFSILLPYSNLLCFLLAGLPIFVLNIL